MIPYLHLEVLQLGHIVIHIWGLFVSLGFLVGLLTAAREARRRGMDEGFLWGAALWIIVGAILGARLFHILFYEPSFYFARPLEILKIWQGGLSSFGGFFGGAAGFSVYFYIVTLTPRPLPKGERVRQYPSPHGRGEGEGRLMTMLSYANPIAFALPLGLAIGRLGCFLTHLHPGIKTNFFLAVQMPDGPRLEMGLIESLFSFALFGYFLLMHRFLAKPPQYNGVLAKARQGLPFGRIPGFFLINFLIFYGLSRFFFDFLRAQDMAGADARYLGLTPAQYGSLVFIAAGMIIWLNKKRI